MMFINEGNSIYLDDLVNFEKMVSYVKFFLFELNCMVKF